MAIPSLTTVFGAGATQTATTLSIAKADLPTLAVAADNSAQQLFVAILLKVAEKLTPEARNADGDFKVTIDYGGQSIFTIAGSTDLDRQDTFTVTLHKRQPSVQIDAVQGATSAPKARHQKSFTYIAPAPNTKLLDNETGRGSKMGEQTYSVYGKKERSYYREQDRHQKCYQYSIKRSYKSI
ncbi:MAG: hypothetical protein Fur006_69630 [Coleofasciculaceae cyanobacterium]